MANITRNTVIAQSGFVASCAETTNFFNELSVQPDDTRKQLYDDLICGLVTAGIYSKLDRFGVYAAHDQQAARVSVVNPTSAQLIEVNVPVFTVDIGYVSF